VNGHGAQSIKSGRTDSASDVCRKAMRQTEQRNAAEQ
jgi:Arc/MetJ-type ribon-helix-helix transcriptional regulator